MFATKQDIERLERKIDKLLGSNSNDSMIEEDMLKLLDRSKSWARKARNGCKTQPALFKQDEWYTFNGRSIHYKRTAVDRVMKLLINS